MATSTSSRTAAQAARAGRSARRSRGRCGSPCRRARYLARARGQRRRSTLVAALRTKRAEISAHIHDLEKKITTWRARLAHIDASIKIFSPETDPEAIPPKRTYRRSGYFRKGEFARLCLDALRKTAGGPVTTAQIVISVLENKGLPHEPALLASLNEKALAYLRQQRKNGGVIKIGTSRDACWKLAK
jgi:hypothetical protein